MPPSFSFSFLTGTFISDGTYLESFALAVAYAWTLDLRTSTRHFR